MAALVLGVAVTRRLRESLLFALELWLAAGLLRLVGVTTWTVIAGVAAVAAVRLVASRTLLSPR